MAFSLPNTLLSPLELLICFVTNSNASRKTAPGENALNHCRPRQRWAQRKQGAVQRKYLFKSENSVNFEENAVRPSAACPRPAPARSKDSGQAKETGSKREDRAHVPCKLAGPRARASQGRKCFVEQFVSLLQRYCTGATLGRRHHDQTT